MPAQLTHGLNPPTIEGIFFAPTAGAPMQALREAELHAGLGLVGDRYHEGIGQYQLHGSPERRAAIRHLSLISAEAIEQAAQAMTATGQQPFTAAETRRNVVTRGLHLEELVGERFLLGEIAVLGEEVCDPCARPSKLAQKEGFSEYFKGARGGLRVAVLNTGSIAIGDLVTLTTLDQVKKARV